MKRFTAVTALRKGLAPLRQQGKTVGLVPTMGALHAGHLELVRRARRRCDVVVVSVFVNPLQFGPGEDFEAYPRRLREDAALLAREGVDLLFVPTAETFYSPDHQTMVVNSAVQSLYCGAFRPGHFPGVLTVVAKLFHAVSPDEAFFGKKDYQQVWLIRKMGKDLHWPVAVRAVPTVRESDGLALSSRNSYLSERERSAAPVLYAVLREIRDAVRNGEKNFPRLLRKGRRRIEEGGGAVQYLEIASSETLLPVKRIEKRGVVLVAAFFGTTRLIDNIEIVLQ